MRILIFIADISRTGGTERATINLANILIKYHEVKIVSLSHSTEPFFSLDKRVEVSCLEAGDFPLAIKRKILWYYKLYRKLKQCVDLENPDVLIGEGHNISSFLPLVKREGIKTLACEHIDFDSIPRLSKQLMKYFYPKLDKVVVLSSLAESKLRHLNKDIAVIANSLPFSVEEPSLLENKRMIMVGRLSVEKGYERIVPLAKKLMQDFPDWKIDIFGNGDLKEEILQLFEKNGLKNVSIKTPTKDIKQEYLNASVHLITSYNEAMPMVILEAQCCGLPVIGYYCEGTASLIRNGETGFVVQNEDEFYDRMKQMIQNETLRIDMGKRARMESQKYSIENIEKQWTELLEAL